MEGIKVSVIIPIWGVENYIERCARHLFEQTLDEMEFIFVNDCTPDKSVEVLKKVIDDYPHRKDRIHIVDHDVNKGLPQARRTGLRFAKGEFVAHHDSDDWADKDMYESLYEAAAANGADVAVCSFKESDGINKPKELAVFPCAKSGVITNKLSCWENEGSLCNKIFRRELYANDITYPTGNMGEDMCLVYQLIRFCKKVAVVPDVCYYIYRNPQSITRIPTRENVYRNFLQGCENCRIVEEFYIRHDAADEETRKAILRLKYSKREILRPIVGIKKYHTIWCEVFPEIDRTLLTDNGLTPREKLKSLMIRLRLFPFPWKKCALKEDPIHDARH